MFLLSAALAAPTTIVESEAWCFGSGLRVIFEEDRARPEVRITTVVEGGSAGEESDEHGLAHLTEHLWFRSRPDTTDGGDIWATTGNIGGRINGYTLRDHTIYTTVAPRRSLRLLLQLEASRIEDPLVGIDGEVFDVERSVVGNELRQRYSNTSGVLSEPLYTALFPEGHPYHDLPIGTEASLAGLTLDKARAYAGRWYTPSNVTVHVSGDLRGEEFIELFPQTFPKGLLVHPDSGAVTKECGTKRADPVALPDVDPPELIRMKGAVRNPVGMIAWSFPPDKWTFASFDLAIAENAMSRALDRGDPAGPTAGAMRARRSAGSPLRRTRIPSRS